MVKKYVRLLFITLSLLAGFYSWAQDSLSNEKPQMAEAMRSNGKIYVVVAVLVTILLGLILYVIRLDRKIGRLEKEGK